MKDSSLMTSSTEREWSVMAMVGVLACNGSREKLFLVKTKSLRALE